MSPHTTRVPMTIRHYLALIRRWLWLLLLCTLVAGAGAFVGSKLQQPMYRASTLLLVNERAPGLDAYSAQLASNQLVQTDLTLVNQPDVLLQAVRQVGGISTTQLSKALHVSNAAGTQTIEIDVDDSSPVRAAQLANAVAAAFISQQQQVAQTQFKAAQNQLNQLITQVSGQVNALTAQVNALNAKGGTDPQLPSLTAQLTGAVTRRDALQTQSDDLVVQELAASNNLQVIQPASPPTSPNQLQPALVAAIGAAVGLAVACGLILLLEFFDDRVRTPDRVEELTTLPVLATIDTGAHNRVLLNGSRGALLVQDYGPLVSALSQEATEKRLQTIAVTSASEREDKPPIAVNLAIAFAESGRRVLLVDADFQHPRVHRLLDIPNSGGLAQVLRDEPVIRAHAVPNVPNLQVLAAGDDFLVTPPLLGPGRASRLMRELAAYDGVDVIVIDTAPVATCPDAATLASRADGTLLVVDQRLSREQALLRTKDVLGRAGAHVVGVVYNRAPVKGSGSNYGQAKKRWPASVGQTASPDRSAPSALRV